MGHVIQIIPCRYKNHKGILFITTKAICFRSTAILSCWEINRVIIPWNDINDIQEGKFGVVVIETGDQVKHEVEHCQIDADIVKSMLNNVWEEQKKHRANATCEESDRDAVQQFYRHTCFLLPSSDSGPEASSEEKGCSFFQDESDDPKDVERMWSEMYNSKDERLTEEVWW